jgi:hypothetical protein
LTLEPLANAISWVWSSSKYELTGVGMVYNTSISTWSQIAHQEVKES